MDAKGRPTSADLPYEVLFRAIATAAAAKPGDPLRYCCRVDGTDLPGKIIARKQRRLEDWGVIADGGYSVYSEEMWRLPVQHEHLREKFRAILAEVGPEPTPEEWTAYNNALIAAKRERRAAREVRIKDGTATVMDFLEDTAEFTVTNMVAAMEHHILHGFAAPPPATGYAEAFIVDVDPPEQTQADAVASLSKKTWP